MAAGPKAFVAVRPESTVSVALVAAVLEPALPEVTAPMASVLV